MRNRSYSHRQKNGGMYGCRKIRPGPRVKFFGAWYRLDPHPPIVLDHVPVNPEAYAGDPPYDGRLDNKWAHFHYYGPGYERLADCIFLVECGRWPGRNCIKSYFRWDRWRKE